MWRQGRAVALARRVRYLSRYYLMFQSVPVETRGGMRASTSLLYLAEVNKAVNAWLHRQPIGTVTPKKFRQVIVDDVLPGHCGHLGKITICERTARRWLKRCGFEPKPTKKGVYEDGHERVDVVEYREQVFLPRMAELERRAVVYEPTDEGEWNVIQPSLAAGERRVVFYFYDESCFHQKDFQRVTWQHHSQQKIPSKGLGRLIHVSDFVTNATSIGRLVHTDSLTGSVEDARVMIKPGSQGDAWWDTKQLVHQLGRAIEIHEMIFGSDVEAVFVFDQSSAHNSMGEGALDAFDMNKSSGANRKKPVVYKDTIVPDDVPNVALRGTVQEMMFRDGDNMQPKGTERILAERGIVPSKGTRAKCNPRCYETNIDCCFARILHNQRDFKEQKCALETLLNEHGHSAVFLPKFHCECNPIEMFWGYSKYLCRQVVKSSLVDAEQEVLKAMASCSGDIIKKYINRAFRFMDAYRKGLKGEAALWVVRKQKSHRRVSEAAMQALEARK